MVRGRLFASTDRGHVYCFAAGPDKEPVVRTPAPPVEPDYPDAATAA